MPSIGQPLTGIQPRRLSHLEDRPKLMKFVHRQKTSRLTLARSDLDSEEW